MADRQQTIAALGAGLAPVHWWRRPASLAWIWLLLSSGFVIVASVLIEPWRPGVGQQVLSTPAFALEIVIATAGFATIVSLAFRTTIPAAINAGFALGFGLLAFLPWLALLVYGLWQPALEPSMLGKRALCYLEVLLLSLPPLVIGLALCRSLYPLRGWATGALLGAAAGMIPGIVMQMACMYIVPHGLTHHVLPIAGSVAVGAALGALVLRR